MVAIINEAATPPVILPTSKPPPTLSDSIRARASTKQIISVIALSKTRTVFVSLLSLRCCVRGITTADDVPLRITPKIRLLIKDSLNKNPIAAAIIIESTREVMLSLIVDFHDLVRSLILISIPPSNRIIIKVIEVNIPPALPMKLGLTSPSKGPTIIPIIINRSTSGIFLFENIIEKRCAANTNTPKKIIASLILVYIKSLYLNQIQPLAL